MERDNILFFIIAGLIVLSYFVIQYWRNIRIPSDVKNFIKFLDKHKESHKLDIEINALKRLSYIQRQSLINKWIWTIQVQKEINGLKESISERTMALDKDYYSKLIPELNDVEDLINNVKYNDNTRNFLWDFRNKLQQKINVVKQFKDLYSPDYIQKILNKEIELGMSMDVIKAIKGSPDKIEQVKQRFESETIYYYNNYQSESRFIFDTFDNEKGSLIKSTVINK